MSCRIRDMRQGILERLKKLGTPGQWDHITSQIGMFSYTGLSGNYKCIYYVIINFENFEIEIK